MPEKIAFVKKYRNFLDGFIQRFPLPNINPSFITALAIPFSVAFIFLWGENQLIALLFYFFVLMSDWLDGVIARKHNRASNKGWLIDSVNDRLSEGVIFLFFFWPWFYFFLANLVLNLVSYFINKNIVFPLRFIFFVYLLGLVAAHYF